MKKLLRAASVLALGSLAYPVAAAEFNFQLDDWSDSGTFSGMFTAEDLNNDGQITSFNNEITSFSATYSGGLRGDIQFTSLNAGPFGFESEPGGIGAALTGLVFTLDGSGQLGDDFFGDIEGLGVYGRSSGADLGNDVYLAVGPGPFNQCDGVSVCGGLFAADDVAFPGVNTQEQPGSDVASEFAALASSSLEPETRESTEETVVEMPLEDPLSVLPTELAIATNTKAIEVDGDELGDPEGLFESSPVLPDGETEEGGFVFNLNDIRNLPGRIFFIDPEIATGYTYEIDGDAFFSVQAPSFEQVADEEYTLTYNEVSTTILSGQLLEFASVDPVTSFTITDIDPSLMLDPESPIAFVTGVSVVNSNEDVIITQTPITEEVNAVPLPAGGVLLLSGLAGLALVRLRRQAPSV